MKMLRYCLKNPVVVCVFVIFLLLFGILAWLRMPYQLLPQVTRPLISIYTPYAGATPYEIEKEVVDLQEKYLKSIPNLLSITSVSREGMGIINLEFAIQTDMKLALLNVNSKLGEVRGYPLDADKPIVKTTGETIPIAVYLFVKTAEGNSENIGHYKNFIYDEILKHYERIDDVGEVYVSGGVSKQIQIILDTQKLAYNNITMDEVISAIRIQNTNISAGNIDFDQRNYRISTIGEYQDISTIYNTIIKARGNKVVSLRSIASVIEGYAPAVSYNIHNNNDVISIQIRPTATANILSLTQEVKKITQTLNNGVMKTKGLEIEWGRDQSHYIKSSIAQVKFNITVGILLAIFILSVFLRSFSSLIVLIFIIPVSVIGSFILLEIFDRTLNVISLAGISFAISMIIDSAIIMMSNIIAHKNLLTSNMQNNFYELFKATFLGAKEVFGALFASTITTVAIFIPVILLNDEAGQLFADIAIASSSSILLSFFVCAFVIPSFALFMFSKFSYKSKLKASTNSFINIFGTKISDFLIKILAICAKNWLSRTLVIVFFIGFCVVFSFLAFPKTDYLPRGHQNFIIGYLNPPPGLSMSEKHQIVTEIQEAINPFLYSNDYKQEDDLQIPVIKDFFISAGTNMYFYLTALKPELAPKLIPYAQGVIDSIPNASGVVLQQGIFSGGGGSSIDINVSGDDLLSLLTTTQELIAALKNRFSDINIRTVPSLQINNREINLYPNPRSLALSGLDMKSFGRIVEVILEGKKVSDFSTGDGKNIDLILKTSYDKNKLQISPEDVLYSQIYTPTGGIIPLSLLAKVKIELGVSQIRHFERNRNILLTLSSNTNTPLEKIVQIITDEILPTIKINKTDTISLGGNAGKLEELRGGLIGGFVLAIAVTYLILSALYGSFLYPFIIILTVPFATTGGILGLYTLNFFIPQNLDVITMLGFIILVGSVVNNAILIVYQTLINFKQYNIPARNAVMKATQSRLAPIFMSTLTSVFALLPLVMLEGSGSEIYRGLGAVIVGGLIFSTLITIFVIPLLLISVIKDKR